MNISVATQRMAGVALSTRDRWAIMNQLLKPVVNGEDEDTQEPKKTDGDDRKTPSKVSPVPPTQPGGSGAGAQPEKKPD